MSHALTSIRHFAHEHDDLPAFHAGYFVLTILAAVLFNIGAFVLIIATHAAMDVVKYRDVHGYSWRLTARGTVRESLVDLWFLSVALVASVYFHHSAGLVAADGFFRSAGELVHLLGVFLPKLRVLSHNLAIFIGLRAHLDEIEIRPAAAWTRLERLSLIGIGTSAFLLAFAPAVLGMPLSTLWFVLAGELVPWRL